MSILRTHIFSTSKSGNILEYMFIKLKNNYGIQNFEFWGYGETKNTGAGSGLYISDIGCTYYHHFSLIPKNALFNFTAGYYEIELIASEFNNKNNTLLKRIHLELSEDQSKLLETGKAAIYFHLNRTSKKYFS